MTDLDGFEDTQRRVLAVTIDGVRIVNLYVPNGQRVGSEKYTYKLAWMAALKDQLAGELARHAGLRPRARKAASTRRRAGGSGPRITPPVVTQFTVE